MNQIRQKERILAPDRRKIARNVYAGKPIKIAFVYGQMGGERPGLHVENMGVAYEGISSLSHSMAASKYTHCLLVIIWN